MTAEPLPAPAGPRRASLSQDRSRETRRRLVRTALTLWTERGFDRGIEETTVEEIAQAAGVTKGTFYFHFAHKEDILLELGWGTGDALYDEAVRWADSGGSGVELVHRLLDDLAERVAAVPRVAVLRSVAQFYGHDAPTAGPDLQRHHLGEPFEMAVELARSQGELPPATDPVDLARMLAAVSMDALVRWAATEEDGLPEALRRRADCLLAGARAARAGRGARGPGGRAGS